MDGDGPIGSGPDVEEELREDAEAGMDKVRLESERPAIVFTGKVVGDAGEIPAETRSHEVSHSNREKL